jgi:dienelactone hydrolase
MRLLRGVSACASRRREVGHDRAAGVGDLYEWRRGDARPVVHAGSHPVVLILRGVAGPDDGYTEIARRLADWGYVALVHGWKVRGADPTDEPVYADLQGAMSFLGSVGQADLTPRKLPPRRAKRAKVHVREEALVYDASKGRRERSRTL